MKELSAKGSYAAAIVAGKQALKDFADTPSAKAIAEAIKEAQTAEAAQAARKKHEADAVDAVKDVHDLMDKHDYAQALKLATQAEKDYADTPSARELKALAKSCEAEIAAAHEAELKRKHQHDAQAALAEAKALFDKKDYAGAVAHAQAALKEYADTPVAKDLEALIAAAKAALATPTPTQAPASTPAATARPALRPAADANSAIAAVRALMIKKDYDTAAAQAKAAAKEFAGTPGGKELTFLRYQCEGLDAMSSKEYRTAVDAFTKALAEKDDADTRDLLKQATGLAKGGAK